jgi:hypothetical protein
MSSYAMPILTDSSDPLTFGTGTLFVRDPDSNLIEFIEEGNPDREARG